MAHGSFPPAQACASAHCCLRSCHLQVSDALDKLGQRTSCYSAPCAAAVAPSHDEIRMRVHWHVASGQGGQHGLADDCATALLRSGGVGDLEQAQRLAAAAAAASWAQQTLPLGRHRWGASFSSEAEWRLAVNRQRDAAAPATLFIHHLLQCLRDDVSAAPSTALIVWRGGRPYLLSPLAAVGC